MKGITTFVLFILSFGFVTAQVGTLPISDSDADKVFEKLMAISPVGEIATRKAQQVIKRLAVKVYGGGAPDVFQICRVLEHLEEAMRRYADRQGNRDGHTSVDEWQKVQDQLSGRPGLQALLELRIQCEKSAPATQP